MKHVVCRFSQETCFQSLMFMTLNYDNNSLFLILPTLHITVTVAPKMNAEYPSLYLYFDCAKYLKEYVVVCK